LLIATAAATLKLRAKRLAAVLIRRLEVER
jgi:hypothetical protein